MCGLVSATEGAVWFEQTGAVPVVALLRGDSVLILHTIKEKRGLRFFLSCVVLLTPSFACFRRVFLVACLSPVSRLFPGDKVLLFGFLWFGAFGGCHPKPARSVRQQCESKRINRANPTEEERTGLSRPQGDNQRS